MWDGISPARFLHDFRPVVSADLAESLVAVDDGEVHYLSVGQYETAVG